jgi:hypothetical protein
MVLAAPVPDNPFHAEIRRSIETAALSSGMARRIALAAQIAVRFDQ